MVDSAKSQHTLEAVPVIRNALIPLQAGDGDCSRLQFPCGLGSVVSIGTQVFISMHLHVVLLGSLIGFLPRTFACGRLCSSTSCGLMIPHFLKETRYGWGNSKFCVCLLPLCYTFMASGMCWARGSQWPPSLGNVGRAGPVSPPGSLFVLVQWKGWEHSRRK